MLEDAYFESGYDVTAMLRVLFNSEFFKDARFAKVKSPAETVAGTMRLVQDFTHPKPGLHPIAMEIRYMGQDLLNPPTVEGWHTGAEWIDSGTLVERINFAADQVGNTALPGVKAIIDRLSSEAVDQPAAFVDRCLDMVGSYQLFRRDQGLLGTTRRQQRASAARFRGIRPEGRTDAATNRGHPGIPIRIGSR